ncbi:MULTISPECIES: hypothetical protein [unclassified Bacillus (in: firmicutes)]|uniref:hypothetical protein n=1 Tax=unclassified Bacillus (in: firmicutes) TaxID=185979 RepID=UPI0008E22CFD|nr:MULTISPECIES: hypothetical protein [unclassified Bacillus (in: firmicutes)]SFA87197.1 hypothetical protein SAMN02799634_102207 [Bacillus sp. UNCCL13]SFQ84119.1 hypothetical protein SAMN04488577_2327 [Bacillus sp. cl95]
MKKTKLGGISSVIVGLLYFLTVIIVLLSPPGANPVVDHVTYMNQLIAVHYILAILGVLGIMVVLAVSNSLEAFTSKSEWYSYSKIMAIIGFSVLALNNFRQIGIDHELSHEAMAKGGETLDTIVMSWVGLVELSPQGWLDFGFVGLWVLTVGIITYKHSSKKILSGLGVVAGACFILTVIGNVTGISLLVMIGMGLGGLVVMPIWFIANGIGLLKRNKQVVSQQSSNVTV